MPTVVPGQLLPGFGFLAYRRRPGGGPSSDPSRSPYWSRTTFHDLRHGYATLNLAGGTDLKVVSELMGHTTINVTADLYQDVIPLLKRDAAERLDGVLSRARLG